MNLVGGEEAQDSKASHRWWTLVAAAAIIALALSTFSFTAGDRAQPAEAASGSGLFVFGSTTGATFTSSNSAGGNYLVSWASLEPQRGVYAWSSVDQALGRARAAGKTLALRVYTNWSGQKQGSPPWFFETPGAEYYYPTNGARSKDYKSPVPWDSVFQDRFGEFLQALGQRYNGNPAIEFIQITGIGVYGEVYLGDLKPSDVSNDKQRDAAVYWVNAWRDAFPTTNLALMVNGLGYNIGETAANRAVSLGYYLQSNNHANTSATRAILSDHDQETKIIIEAEDGGCPSATMSTGFDDQMSETFSFGYDIDYLMLCYQTFTDTQTKNYLPSVEDRLRSSSSTSSPILVSETNTPQPTATSVPATSTPVPNAPANEPSSSAVIRSDDFNTPSLNTSLWDVVDPVGGASVSTVGAGSGNAQLRIAVPGGVSHNPYYTNNAVRVMQPAADTDFQIEAKFDSAVTELNQIQGFLIQQDSDDWLRFDVYSDGAHTKLYAGSTVNGTTATKKNVIVSTGVPLWLRVTRQGDKWTNSYSNNGTTWITLVSYTRAMTVTSVGVMAGNHSDGGVVPAHTALVDYFFNTASPIRPEDGSQTAAAATATPTATARPASATPTATPRVATPTATPTRTAVPTAMATPWWWYWFNR
jgi:regulation of enolase protein 1 (concanavalin A-like superfamily)